MGRFFAHLFGTVLGIGHIPVVPATWTSLAVALLFYLGQPGLTAQIFLLLLFTVTGIFACTALEREYGEDPKQATADEAAGMSLGLLGAPLDPLVVLVAFLLFRLYDVTKPPPARRAEDLPEGWGIMTDDLVAGVYTRLTLALLLWVWRGAPA